MFFMATPPVDLINLSTRNRRIMRHVSLTRADCSLKLSYCPRKTIVREVIKTPMTTLMELYTSGRWDGRNCAYSNSCPVSSPVLALCRSGKEKVTVKENSKSQLGFAAEKHLTLKSSTCHQTNRGFLFAMFS